jgi:ubiquitin-protein ligase
MDDSFKIKFTQGEIVGQWDWTFEIPLFKTVARIGKAGWDKRLQEEIEKIEYLKKMKKENIFFTNVEKDPQNARIFNAEGTFEQDEKVKFIIRLSIQYPFAPPTAEEFYYGKYSYYISEHGKVACLNQINNRWNKEGRHGIAHFLAMLGYYTALARYNVDLAKRRKTSVKKRRSRS